MEAWAEVIVLPTQYERRPKVQTKERVYKLRRII
jgi:hypothetical protein